MQERLKILQVAAVGMTVRFLLLPLLERLRAEGHDVEAASSPDAHLDDVEQRGFRVHRVQIARKLLSIRHIVTLAQLARLFRQERFDVVHLHTPVAAALGRIAARMARVPLVVYTAHGFYFHDRMPTWKRRLIMTIEACLGDGFTDLLFTQSREDAAWAQHRLRAPEKVVWIGNGVDVSAFPKRDALSDAFRSELGVGPEALLVGYVGRLVPEKGLNELLRAMAGVVRALPQAHLVLIGDTLPSDRAGRFVLPDASPGDADVLREHVHGLGFREDVPRLLATFDVFVLPSHREGMPRAVLEAMAAGVAVVATDIRGCREEVVDGVTGRLVPVEDADALRDALVALLRDDELRQRMGTAGRARAAALFDEADVLDRQVAGLRAAWASRRVPGSTDGAPS